MKKRYNSPKFFLTDTTAVSEEFTALPALAVVMIGITLFILLVTNVYAAYETRIDSIKKYQTADFIANKLTNQNCPFSQTAGIVQLTEYTQMSSNPFWQKIQQEYQAAGIGFMLRLSWTDTQGHHSIDVPPCIPSFDLNKVGNRVAVSRDVTIQLNPVTDCPGKLTIITWSV
ncbi:MAG: hypothetical protein QXL17_02455 [Candidatus Thermoplasmatota archaeon]